MKNLEIMTVCCKFYKSKIVIGCQLTNFKYETSVPCQKINPQGSDFKENYFSHEKLLLHSNIVTTMHAVAKCFLIGAILLKKQCHRHQ